MYNMWVPVVTLILIGILSFGWKLYFSAYIKRNKAKVEKRQRKSNALNRIYPVRVISHICIMCSVFLANTDDKVADTLRYIKPTAHLDHILEKHNG